MGVRVIITGDKGLIRSLRKFGRDAEKGIGEVTEFTARDAELNAKKEAPVDTGKLRQNIITEKETNLHYKVIALEDYAPYMEFGTGDKAIAPEIFKDQADQFRGAGIRNVNLKPQPFMYPAYVIARTNFKKDLKDELQFLTDKFNA